MARTHFKAWLYKNGGFYFKRRHTTTVFCIVDQAKEISSPIEEIIGEIIDSKDIQEIQNTIRQLYISPTGILMIHVEFDEKNYFLRFPFTKNADQRIKNQTDILKRLFDNGIKFGPELLNINYPSLKVYAESGVSGKSVSVYFRTAQLQIAQEIVKQTLQKIEQIYMKYKQYHLFDRVLFDRFLQPHIDIIANKIPESKKSYL